MDDKIAAGLAARIAERDANDDGEWRNEKALSRQEADRDKREDDASRREALDDAIIGSIRAGKERAAAEPQAPPAPGPDASLCDEIRNAIAWHKMPEKERKALAATAAEIELAREAGKMLGIEVKTAADVNAMMEAHDAKAQAGKRLAAQLPAAQRDAAQLPALQLAEAEALALAP